jgi:hypothetical protein
MDPKQVTIFCDAAAKLLPTLGEYAATDPEKRKPEDDALVRQLRVAASALANVMVEVSRMTPAPVPPMPPMPPMQRSPKIGAPS